MAQRLPDRKLVQILADAERLGDKAAAKKYGVTDRTLRRYRKAASPAVTAGAEQKKAVPAVTDQELREKVRFSRMRFLERLNVLVETSTDLKVVAGAYKLITDNELAQKVVAPDGQSEQRPGVEGSGSAPPTTNGSGDPASRVH